MIARSWRGTTKPDKAEAYVRHLRDVVFPEMQTIDGHRGATILRRQTTDQEVQFTILTFWSSMAAIGRFAGNEPDRAVVPPEARALLATFDERVEHFEVVSGPDAEVPCEPLEKR